MAEFVDETIIEHPETIASHDDGKDKQKRLRGVQKCAPIKHLKTEDGRYTKTPELKEKYNAVRRMKRREKRLENLQSKIKGLREESRQKNRTNKSLLPENVVTVQIPAYSDVLSTLRDTYKCSIPPGDEEGDRDNLLLLYASCALYEQLHKDRRRSARTVVKSMGDSMLSNMLRFNNGHCIDELRTVLGGRERPDLAVVIPGIGSSSVGLGGLNNASTGGGGGGGSSSSVGANSSVHTSSYHPMSSASDGINNSSSAHNLLHHHQQQPQQQQQQQQHHLHSSIVDGTNNTRILGHGTIVGGVSHNMLGYGNLQGQTSIHSMHPILMTSVSNNRQNTGMLALQSASSYPTSMNLPGAAITAAISTVNATATTSTAANSTLLSGALEGEAAAGGTRAGAGGGQVVAAAHSSILDSAMRARHSLLSSVAAHGNTGMSNVSTDTANNHNHHQQHHQRQHQHQQQQQQQDFHQHALPGAEETSSSSS